MRSYVTEFVGTFFFVFTIGMASGDLAPLAIGSALMVMVYMGGHVSGAHYNPAVTLAVWLRGKLDAKEIAPYMASQVAGAFAAALAVHAIRDKTFAPAPGAETVPALLNEILYTLALALVVLNVATNPKTDGNSYFGLAIGFTFAVGAFAGGSVSGGAYNPAVGLGPTLFQGGDAWSDIWLYLVGPFAGGAAAAFVYKIQNPN